MPTEFLDTLKALVAEHNAREARIVQARELTIERRKAAKARLMPRLVDAVNMLKFYIKGFEDETGLTPPIQESRLHALPGYLYPLKLDSIHDQWALAHSCDARPNFTTSSITITMGMAAVTKNPYQDGQEAPWEDDAQVVFICHGVFNQGTKQHLRKTFTLAGPVDLFAIDAKVMMELMSVCLLTSHAFSAAIMDGAEYEVAIEEAMKWVAAFKGAYGMEAAPTFETIQTLGAAGAYPEIDEPPF